MGGGGGVTDGEDPVSTHGLGGMVTVGGGGLRRFACIWISEGLGGCVAVCKRSVR